MIALAANPLEQDPSMPQFKLNLGSGLQYLGAVGTGLFVPGNTGSASLQIRLNSIRFHTSVAVAFAYYSIDPDDSANKTLLFGDTNTDLSDDTGRLLVSNNDGTSWNFSFETAVLGADGFLTVDYDFEGTEG